ncbi:uroporphyrinogen-III synthase [Dyella jiangningensis]|uniref:uroporphyrinogen-III synthase n=1 Tax=Dyella sp. AtDHG13 TaxID=1938897 RepID=UPI00088C44F2|nr:uroporphyrinogen-III synthase [Dyella sp. AtDHG13]PXV59173.1 uroporphyrinogen-III synthase [Dyella sp. AtDHG13]SDK24815.1 uroporphyrinogen-III synthase [Dyella jiangningensis]
MTARPPIPAEHTLDGRTVVITRPAGTGSPMARKVRSLGGLPLLLPGLSLRAVDGPEVAAAVRAALGDALLVFTSPAAVRFAARLVPLTTQATVLAVGKGTARALARLGIHALVPPGHQDSEGLLAHPALAKLEGRRVALIGAPGGRGVLRDELAARGARLREVHVYRRAAPRWQRRQLDAVRPLPAESRVLLSSAEALENLRLGLPGDVFAQLRRAVAVASSERIAVAAREAGFTRIVIADSALSEHLLAAAARP